MTDPTLASGVTAARDPVRTHGGGHEAFDGQASRYRSLVESSFAFTGKDLDFFSRAKVREVVAAARRWVGDPRTLDLLDVGCGVGVLSNALAARVRSVHGVDTAADMVDAARALDPGSTYTHYRSSTLPFDGPRFDLTLAVNVVHHIAPSARSSFLRELCRVTRPDGIVMVIEHNPMNPLTRLAVRRCALDDECELVGPRGLDRAFVAAGLTVMERRFFLFSPFDLPALARVERALSWLPLGAQHLVIGRGTAPRAPNSVQ